MSNSSGGGFGSMIANVQSFRGTELVDPLEDDLAELSADVGIFGFPFDSTCMNRTGTNQGPQGIRQASTNTLGYHYEYDINLDDTYDIVDCGDVEVVPGNAGESLSRAEHLHGSILEADMIPIMLGGNHTVPIAGYRGLGQHAENPGLVFLDTHIDTAEEVAGEKYTHACPVARAIDEAGFEPSNISIIGASGNLNPEYEVEYVKEKNINLYPLDEVIERGPIAVANDAVTAATRDTDALYLDIDVDVLDTGFAPGTGTPSPAGMTSRELLQVLGVVGSAGIDAMSIVETAPIWDDAGITSQIAVRMIMDTLAANATGEANGVGSGTRAARHGYRS
ncbi:agmatinase [Halonotius pteroides]|uniref:Agmatinase n=2 Tax=Halonotius pteroides TaxID=268735 RepID=A0A3A6Q7W5_9EURY|nr:agmatinase [Halonotius pteroides]